MAQYNFDLNEQMQPDLQTDFETDFQTDLTEFLRTRDDPDRGRMGIPKSNDGNLRNPVNLGIPSFATDTVGSLDDHNVLSNPTEASSFTSHSGFNSGNYNTDDQNNVYQTYSQFPVGVPDAPRLTPSSVSNFSFQPNAQTVHGLGQDQCLLGLPMEDISGIIPQAAETLDIPIVDPLDVRGIVPPEAETLYAAYRAFIPNPPASEIAYLSRVTNVQDKDIRLWFKYHHHKPVEANSSTTAPDSSGPSSDVANNKILCPGGLDRYRDRSGKYECYKCHIRFQKKHDYKRHLETNNPPKWYNCTYCGDRWFARKDKLKKHITPGHRSSSPSSVWLEQFSTPNKQKFPETCEICGRMSNSWEVWFKHLIAFHSTVGGQHSRVSEQISRFQRWPWSNRSR